MQRAKKLSFVLADFICAVTASSAKAVHMIVSELLRKGSLNWILARKYIFDDI
jgi:hypothetical protein